MNRAPFTGIITAIVTPFDKNGEIDRAAYQKILRIQKNAGISGVVVAGTTGESPTIGLEEKEKLLRVALEERTEDFHVYIGTGSNCTAETISDSKTLMQTTSKTGQKPDGMMAVVPYYNKPNQAGMYAHFKTIADALPESPLCVYNVPGRTGCALQPNTFVRLARECRSIVALKEAAGDLRAVAEFARELEAQGLTSRVSLLSGDDLTFVPALLAGATGLISVTGNVAPRELVQQAADFRAGRLSELRASHLRLYPIHAAMLQTTNPIPVKWTLEYLGACQGGLRLPMTPLEGRDLEVVRAAVDSARDNGVRFL
jgi:4-hydroxy-tetrahydrodipicolinate synthase